MNTEIIRVGDTVEHRWRGEGKVIGVEMKRSMTDDIRVVVRFDNGLRQVVYADQLKVIKHYQPN